MSIRFERVLKTGEYFLIAIVGQSNQKLVRKILSDCWSLNVADVYVLTVSDDEDTIDLHTFFPYDEKCSDSVNSKIVNQFRDGRFVSDLQVFVNKFGNLRGCPLRVLTKVYYPTMIIRDEGNQVILDGVDGKLIKLLASAMNFTIVVKIPNGVLRHSMGKMVTILRL